MDGRLSDNRGVCALCNGTERSRIPACLHNLDRGSVLFSDHHSGVRDMVPSQASEAPRQLQVMADLLTPFAGSAAPELARQLRAQFGSLSRALAAPRSQWSQIERGSKDVCDLIFAARELIDTARAETLQSAKIDPRDPDFQSYLRSRLCRGPGETLLVIFCDNQGRYLIDEEMGWGGAQHVRVDVANLFRRALSVGAASLFLAHNHPSGNCRPSEEDITATRELASAGHVLGFEILDHLIITHDKAYSMRAGGEC